MNSSYQLNLFAIRIADLTNLGTERKMENEELGLAPTPFPFFLKF